MKLSPIGYSVLEASGSWSLRYPHSLGAARRAGPRMWWGGMGSDMVPWVQTSGKVHAGEAWESLPTAEGITYAWDANSTYITRPPFLDRQQTPIGDSARLAHTSLLLFC